MIGSVCPDMLSKYAAEIKAAYFWRFDGWGETGLLEIRFTSLGFYHSIFRLSVFSYRQISGAI